MRTVGRALPILCLFLACTSVPEPQAPIVEPVVEPVPVAPAPEAVDNPPPADEVAVSEEKREASLAEIRDLVDRLNAIIARSAFTEWKLYLDQDYLKTYGDPVLLKAYSTKSPILKQYKINLRTLEDYFKFVVVPSRAEVTVDSISFVDENRVRVWTVVDNERVLLYLLKLYGKEWKISSW